MSPTSDCTRPRGFQEAQPFDQNILGLILMKPRARIIRIVIACALAIVPVSAALSQTADNVLLVVNDKSEDSKAIARYYTGKRNLPAPNLCHVSAPESETISRIVFERDILRPVADCLRSRGLQDQILYIVTTRGLPVIVEGDAGPAGDLAAVDSELALTYRYLVPGSFPYQGRIENPYFMIDFNRGDFRPFTRRDYDIYLVTRLTGASADRSLCSIDRALAPEPGGDFYFDLASAQQSAAADWTQQAAAALKDAGFKPTIDMTRKDPRQPGVRPGLLQPGPVLPAPDSRRFSGAPARSQR